MTLTLTSACPPPTLPETSGTAQRPVLLHPWLLTLPVQCFTLSLTRIQLKAEFVSLTRP